VLQQEREVLDNLVVPAMVIDEKGTIHGYNSAASTMLGYSLIEVVGKNIKMLMTTSDR
jgi:PAS domain S-box-containing protein